jgi:ankyrin repeat protein
MSAVLSGAIDNVDYLLQLGADTTIGEKDGYTPVHGAGFQGRSRIMEKLIAHGLDPNDRHSDGYTPLHRAGMCGNGQYEICIKFYDDQAPSYTYYRANIQHFHSPFLTKWQPGVGKTDTRQQCMPC